MLRRLLLATCLCALTSLPAFAQDAADIVVRLNRVENVTRQLSGQIEQLQYENRQLKEQLRRFQEDVEFRFQEGKGGGRPPAAAAPSPPARKPAAAPPSEGAPARKPSAAPPGDGAPYGTNPGGARPEKRGDAFDPERNPGAPGAPRPLGETKPSLPLNTLSRAGREMQVVGTVPDDNDGAREDVALPPPGFGEQDRDRSGHGEETGALAAAMRPSIAASGSGNSRADFEAAYALVRERRYDEAEMGLRQFLQSHPRDALVPRATYWLGESYLQRNRSREAAEQFLKVSTDFPNSGVAPEAMLKLGASLAALGAKSQACATLAEVDRKFPGAAQNVKQGIEREMKRARCEA